MYWHMSLLHANQGNGESIRQELLLNDNGFLDNLLHELGWGRLLR